MANRRGSRTLARAPRRTMFWQGSAINAVVTTGAVSTAVAVTESEMENIPNPTLIRIHGEIIVAVTAIGAAGAEAMLSMGLIIQDARAVAAGVGGMPVPFGGIASDWIWHKMVPLSVPVAIATENDAMLLRTRFVVDNKSMRKFQENQALVMNFQNTAITGTLTASVIAGFRFLFKK